MMIAYQKLYGGCARWTVAALQDAMPFIPVDDGLRRAGTCLDAETTPAGLHSCGAFTGCLLVIGYLCGANTGDEGNQQCARLAHDLARRIRQRFNEEYGSVLCKDIREAADGNCPDVVGKAAKWAAEILLKKFSDAS